MAPDMQLSIPSAVQQDVPFYCSSQKVRGKMDTVGQKYSLEAAISQKKQKKGGYTTLQRDSTEGGWSDLLSESSLSTQPKVNLLELCI